MSPPETASPETGGLPVTSISSDPRVRLGQALRDLAEYRELFLAFVVRDLRVRYKQTALGVVWVVLQPLVTGVVFSLVFSLLRGRLSGTETLLFFMAGLVPWSSFQSGVQMAATSLEAHANLVSKVYFPRLVIPGAFVIGSALDFVISFAVFVGLAAFMGGHAGMLLLAMPGLLLIQMITALGAGFFLSALNAQYRDVKYAIPFVLQIGMFLTVLVPLETWGTYQGAATISPTLHTILSFNPMAAVSETYRSLLTERAVDWLLIGKGAGVSLVVLLLGLQFFNHRERRLADIL